MAAAKKQYIHVIKKHGSYVNDDQGSSDQISLMVIVILLEKAFDVNLVNSNEHI